MFVHLHSVPAEAIRCSLPTYIAFVYTQCKPKLKGRPWSQLFKPEIPKHAQLNYRNNVDTIKVIANGSFISEAQGAVWRGSWEQRVLFLALFV